MICVMQQTSLRGLAVIVMQQTRLRGVNDEPDGNIKCFASGLIVRPDVLDLFNELVVKPNGISVIKWLQPFVFAWMRQQEATACVPRLVARNILAYLYYRGQMPQQAQNRKHRKTSGRGNCNKRSPMHWHIKGGWPMAHVGEFRKFPKQCLH